MKSFASEKQKLHRKILQTEEITVTAIVTAAVSDQKKIIEIQHIPVQYSKKINGVLIRKKILKI